MKETDLNVIGVYKDLGQLEIPFLSRDVEVGKTSQIKEY